jgi:murein L,D-transpeptidase YcbB/YkuD
MSLLAVTLTTPLPAAAVTARLHALAVERQRVATLYPAGSARAFWSKAAKVTRQGREVLGLLERAGDYGLQPADYAAAALAQRLSELQHSDAGADPRAAVAAWLEFDRLLSGSVLAFVDDVHCGRIDPHAAGFELAAARGFDDLGFIESLARTADVRALIATIEPQYIHYRLLEAALPHYRVLAADPSLTELPPLPGRSLAPGERYAGAPALRRLLGTLGCMPTSGTLPVDTWQLDAPLVRALQCFQWLHGLRVDGTLGSRTYAALTLPLAQRVRQMELTLERWRWLPPLRDPTVIVNIPQFRLFAFASDSDREQDMLRMNVIVGQEYGHTRTPVFIADLRTVVFRPYWDIPRSIATREILPALTRDPLYLQKQHMELVDGPMDSSPVVAATPANLQALAAGRLRLRQQPGPDNALGLIKFLLPNIHDVYLHATPATHLFDRARRTFSHGCIRLSDAVDLARFVLRGTPGDWTGERIVAAMNGARTLRVTVTHPVHVLILYGTAVASEDGQLHFFDDIYGQDRRLQALLGLPPVLPEPYAAGIDVHEVRPGIVAHATARQ